MYHHTFVFMYMDGCVAVDDRTFVEMKLMFRMDKDLDLFLSTLIILILKLNRSVKIMENCNARVENDVILS